MAKKTLKIKRVFAWTIYNNLKQIAPKDYPTTGEIKSTISDILPALKEHVMAYVDNMKKAEELGVKMAAKEISEEESNKLIDKINADWKVYNRDHGMEMVSVEIDSEGMTTLRSQFDRENWGKKWVSNIEEFGELMESFAEAGK